MTVDEARKELIPHLAAIVRESPIEHRKAIVAGIIAGLREGFGTIEPNPANLERLFSGLDADVLIEISIQETA